MDKTLKEKLIDSTFQGINKIIENTYKNHPDEKSYSVCRLQEGYDDYLKITFKEREINYDEFNFAWKGDPNLKIDFYELGDIKKDEFIKEIIPEIKSKFKEVFFKYEDSFVFRYKLLLIIEFEEENDLLEDIIYREELYFENKKRKEKLKSKMENYIKEVILEEKKAMKDGRECVVFCINLLDFNLMRYSEKYLIELIEKILRVMKSPKNKELEKKFQYYIIYQLERWVDNIFLKIEPEKVTDEQIELYIYSNKICNIQL